MLDRERIIGGGEGRRIVEDASSLDGCCNVASEQLCNGR
jgi:hypothetical protein